MSRTMTEAEFRLECLRLAALATVEEALGQRGTAAAEIIVTRAQAYFDFVTAIPMPEGASDATA